MNSKKTFKPKSEWSERVVSIERVTKVVKGGKKMSSRAVIVVGNEQGKVGVGVGKASDVITAVRKGVTDGKKHIISVPLTSSNTIPHATNGRFGAAKLCAPCLCAAQDGCRMGLLLLDQAGAPNQLLSQLQLQLNTDLLSIKDSPEQGLVVCFGLACAGSLFGCRLGVR